MSESDIVTIPFAAALRLRDLDLLCKIHGASGLVVIPRDGAGPLTFGYDGEDRGPRGAARLVSELLRLARFALLVREIAECRPGDTVADVVNQVHNELRSRP